MIAVLILAVSVVTLSATALAASWRGYGAGVAIARQEARDCPQMREVRYRIVEYGAKPAGQVIALPVRTKPALVTPRQPLRAAA